MMFHDAERWFHVVKVRLEPRMRRVVSEEPRASGSFDIGDDNSAKLQIVLAIYSSMLSSAQEIRASTQRAATLGASGILLLCAWMVNREGQTSTIGKVFISGGIVVFVGMFVAIIQALGIRYRGVALVIRRINVLQLVYQESAYLDGQILFPDHFRTFGSAQWKEPIFRLSYVSLVVIGAFGMCSVWLL
jgi:hypothetical protein